MPPKTKATKATKATKVTKTTKAAPKTKATSKKAQARISGAVNATGAIVNGRTDWWNINASRRLITAIVATMPPGYKFNYELIARLMNCGASVSSVEHEFRIHRKIGPIALACLEEEFPQPASIWDPTVQVIAQYFGSSTPAGIAFQFREYKANAKVLQRQLLGKTDLGSVLGDNNLPPSLRTSNTLPDASAAGDILPDASSADDSGTMPTSSGMMPVSSDPALAPAVQGTQAVQASDPGLMYGGVHAHDHHTPAYAAGAAANMPGAYHYGAGASVGGSYEHPGLSYAQPGFARGAASHFPAAPPSLVAVPYGHPTTSGAYANPAGFMPNPRASLPFGEAGSYMSRPVMSAGLAAGVPASTRFPPPHPHPHGYGHESASGVFAPTRYAGRPITGPIIIDSDDEMDGPVVGDDVSRGTRGGRVSLADIARSAAANQSQFSAPPVPPTYQEDGIFGPGDNIPGHQANYYAGDSGNSEEDGDFEEDFEEGFEEDFDDDGQI